VNFFWHSNRRKTNKNYKINEIDKTRALAENTDRGASEDAKTFKPTRPLGTQQRNSAHR
jgi:hypothetical protein